MSLAHTNGIQNWDNFNVKLDFSNLRFGQYNLRPSDIDMFFLYGNTLIIGDAKNERGVLHDGQRKVYERLIDRWCKAYGHKGLFMWFSHDVYQQNGGTTVDVADCPVVETYYNDGHGGIWSKSIETVETEMNKVLPEDMQNTKRYEAPVYEEPLNLDNIDF